MFAIMKVGFLLCYCSHRRVVISRTFAESVVLA